MKRLLWIIPLLLCTLPAQAQTWSLVQHRSNTACANNTSTCTVTMTQATGSGNLLIVTFVGVYGGTVQNITSITAGAGTYTHCSNCANHDSSGDSLDMGYVLSSNSGVSSIVVTLNVVGHSGGVWAVSVNEYHLSSGSFSFDVSNSSVDSTACTSCAGQALTLTGSNDVIGQLASPFNACSTISSPYSNPNDTTTSQFAGAINQSSGAAPTWTCTSGTTPVAAMAFKASGGGSTVRHRAWVIQR